MLKRGDSVIVIGDDGFLSDLESDLSVDLSENATERIMSAIEDGEVFRVKNVEVQPDDTILYSISFGARTLPYAFEEANLRYFETVKENLS